MDGTMDKIFTNKLFRIEKFPYRILEVQVDNRMRDKNYIDIVNIIHSLMKDIRKRVVFNKDGIVYTKCQPISFEILYNSNTEITFNFAVNELDSLYFKNRLQTILPNSTLTFRNDYIDEFKNSTMYNYQYDKHYMLSLNTKISPIQSLLAIKKDLGGDEKLLLQTIILPIGDMWKNTCYDNWVKIRKGQDVTNNSILLAISNFMIDIFNEFFSIIDDIVEAKPKSEVENNHISKRLINEFDSDSKTKMNNDGFKVDINSFIKSSNNLQCYNIGKSIETCYKDMTLDNNLKIAKKKDVNTNRTISFFNKTIMSGLELANLIKLPDNILQRRFNIKNIRINQIDIPKECNKGNINLGKVEYHGDIKNWYMPLDGDIGCLPLFLLTKMGGGKTTLILNICNDAKKNGEGLVLFDYVKDCQTAKALIEMYKDDINIIRFDDIDHLDNFSFPEVCIDETSTPFERKVQANIIADEVRYLLNSMATDSEPLTRIMNNYLVSACKVVFVYKNKTLKDLLDVLEEKDIRNDFISKCITDGLYTENSREIKRLKELDDKITYGRIQGLLDRFSVITNQEILCEMLDSNVSRVNFVDVMDNGKPIVILMPEDIFTNRYLKEIICTYYMSRIRLAMKRKKSNKICRVVVDEVHQIPKTMNLIKDTIAELRKFRIGYVMAMHSFSQLAKDIKESILDIGCHFMMLKGVSENGFNELKGYIGDEFEYEDMKEMDWDYGSLNLINIKNQYYVFMSQLPDPLKDIRGKLFIGD